MKMMRETQRRLFIDVRGPLAERGRAAVFKRMGGGEPGDYGGGCRSVEGELAEAS